MRLAFAAAIAACLIGLPAIPADAAPSAAQTAADRARVDAAMEKLEAARQESAAVDARVEEASAELDALIAEQERARDRLSLRARTMYRSGEGSFITVLFGAQDFRDFVTRWDLLIRMNRQDAADLVTLQTARAESEQSANSLIALQAEQAQAIDAVAAEVARAREQLAANEAALREYEARIAAQAKASKPAESAAAPTQSDSTPQTGGSGAWQTAVASHYGRNFSGRGASGKEIGPYSMIVAHRTLPFGTLVEFEYHGRRAVASVEDRGPHVPGRTWDLGPGVVRILDFSGVDEVRWRVVQ